MSRARESRAETKLLDFSKWKITNSPAYRRPPIPRSERATLMGWMAIIYTGRHRFFSSSGQRRRAGKRRAPAPNIYFHFYYQEIKIVAQRVGAAACMHARVIWIYSGGFAIGFWQSDAMRSSLYTVFLSHRPPLGQLDSEWPAASDEVRSVRLETFTYENFCALHQQWHNRNISVSINCY